jgi:hypothetical protein
MIVFIRFGQQVLEYYPQQATLSILDVALCKSDGKDCHHLYEQEFLVRPV